MNDLTFNLPITCKKEIIAHVTACLPEETCGLVGGDGLNARVVIPVSNLLHRNDRFQMDPREQWQAFQWMEANQLTLAGVFHSHPQGPRFPSETDIKEYMYADSLALICYPVGEDWEIRGFWIVNGTVEEQTIKIVE